MYILVNMDTLKNLCIKALQKKILDLATVEDMLLGYSGLEEIYLTEIIPIYMDHILENGRYKDKVCKQKVSYIVEYQYTNDDNDIPLDMKIDHLDLYHRRRSYSSKYTPRYQTLYDTEREYLPKIPTKMYNALYKHM